jgi:hypothetical protein
MAEKLPSVFPLSDSSRFSVPNYSSHSRDPSPSSPARHGHFVADELDPLLADLSPISTLEALRANHAISPLPGTRQKLLADSIAEASQNERALGIRAALAGKKLKEWVDEVGAWHWPSNKFEPPATRSTTHNGSNPNGANNHDTYWGSLPSKIVFMLEERIEVIKDDLETLEVQDLKNYVRNAHVQPQSRSASGSSYASFTSATTSYNRLADFTVIITATIVQALPYLARLQRLLTIWSIRLSILRRVPGFLQQLEDTKIALESAWSTISQAAHPDAGYGLTRETYVAIKGVLEDRVTDLARRIDAILDSLEGHSDTIPDKWIDDMEDAQTDFENWVVEAERLVLLYEWHAFKATQSQKVSDTQINHNKGIEQEINDTATTSKQKTTNEISISENSHLVKQNPAENITVARPSETPDKPKVAQDPPISTSPITPVGSQSGSITSPKRGLFFMRGSPTQSQTDSSPNSPGKVRPIETAEIYQSLARANSDGASQPLIQEPSKETDLPRIDITERIAVSRNLSEETIHGEKASKQVELKSSPRKPAPLNLSPPTTSVDGGPSTAASFATISSDGYSNMSSPQILDAASVQFFKSPMEDQFPSHITREVEDIPSRNSSQRTVGNRLGHGRSISAVEPSSRSRSSSYLSQVTINGNEVKEESGDDELEDPIITSLRKASTASIESLPRSEVSL